MANFTQQLWPLLDAIAFNASLLLSNNSTLHDQLGINYLLFQNGGNAFLSNPLFPPIANEILPLLPLLQHQTNNVSQNAVLFTPNFQVPLSHMYSIMAILLSSFNQTDQSNMSQIGSRQFGHHPITPSEANIIPENDLEAQATFSESANSAWSKTRPSSPLLQASLPKECVTHLNSVTCTLCLQKFETKRLFNYHVREEHANELMACIGTQKCKAVSTDKTDLASRVHVVDNEADILQCCQCEFIAWSVPTLVAHATEHYGRELFECGFEGCDFVAIARHIVETHHGQVHVPILCPLPQCGKRFALRSNLRAHMRAVHENIRKFKCPVADCTMAFTRRYSLQNHMCTHSESHPYRCKWPGCSFDTKYFRSIYEHVRKVHFRQRIGVREQDAWGIIERREPRDFIQFVQ